VKGDVVDHHDVPALEGGNQTLFDVGQEGFSVHDRRAHGHQDTMGAGGENELDIVAWINGQLMELRYAETPRR
jgi:hypothetical protein